MKGRLFVRLNIVLLMGLLGAVIPSVAFAEGTCGRNTGIVPDGRVTQSTIPAGVTFWYNLDRPTPGRSYSVEFRSVIDRPPTFPFTLTVTTNCSGSPYPGTRNTNTIDPGVQAGGERRSFTVTAENPVVMFSFTNPNSVAMTYSFSVSETTMFSSHHSTGGGWAMGYYFANITNAPINGVLTIYRADVRLGQCVR